MEETEWIILTTSDDRKLYSNDTSFDYVYEYDEHELNLHRNVNIKDLRIKDIDTGKSGDEVPAMVVMSNFGKIVKDKVIDHG